MTDPLAPLLTEAIEALRDADHHVEEHPSKPGLYVAGGRALPTGDVIALAFRLGVLRDGEASIH